MQRCEWSRLQKSDRRHPLLRKLNSQASRQKHRQGGSLRDDGFTPGFAYSGRRVSSVCAAETGDEMRPNKFYNAL